MHHVHAGRVHLSRHLAVVAPCYRYARCDALRDVVLQAAAGVAAGSVSQAPNGVGSNASGGVAGNDGSLADATNTAAAAHAFGTADGNGGGIPTMNGNGNGNGTSAFASPLRTKAAGSAKPVSSGAVHLVCLGSDYLAQSRNEATGASLSQSEHLQPAPGSWYAGNI